MAAVGRIIRDAAPTFITLQEVTPRIQALLRSCNWWRDYVASDPPETGQPYYTLMLAHKAQVPGVTPRSFRRQAFGNSVMGRCLLTVMTSVGGAPLAVATSHLESPCPPQGMFVAERGHQLREVMRVLEAAPAGNVLFAGDLNWVDARDGAPPLAGGWCDAWLAARPGDPGFTYDTRSNKMLVGNWPGNRLDRVLARLRDMRISSMRLVGQDAIPGVTYVKEFRNGGSKRLPVLPSDHYGLLLELDIT
ncbi:MAG: Endonuclease/exonuclease/phosphatase [Monoraphidium minutum]|nr:MAG: Endonuclease/exonuclease/phosphatase [Monoraphidium minutum]